MIPSFELPAAMVDRLGWVLVHSLWQFALIAAAALVLSRALRSAPAETRYVAMLAAFSLMAGAPAATWVLSSQSASVSAPSVVVNRTGPASLPNTAGAGVRTGAPSDSSLAADQPDFKETSGVYAIPPAVSWSPIERLLRPWLNTIVSIWCCGVLGFALRPVLGWVTVRRLRTVGVSPVPDALQRILDRTAQRLKVRRAVRILQSTLVQVPLVAGYLRPVILLPASIIISLPASQLEAILTHELAHIRRHDYFINFLQTLVETFFFYHPAVWWLSRQIRNERENCCDDLAVALLGNRVEYAHALLSVEELRGTISGLAVGAAGGSLLMRIRRVLQAEPQRRVAPASWLSGAALSSMAVSSLAVAIGLTVSLSVSAQNRADRKDDGAKTTGGANQIVDDDANTEQGGADDKPDEKTRSLDIVIARHVMMWDGEIKTWDEIIAGLRAIRKQAGKPIHPNFKFSNGAIKAGLWDRYQTAAFEVYKELFEPAGMSIGSISPRAGDRYDAIRTSADLVPKPESVRTGIIRNAAGRPVAVATVLLMPEDTINSVMLQSNMSLRDPLDEVWTSTDKVGRFTIAAPETGYRLVVLSPAGFALAPIPKFGEQTEITLSRNAELQVSSADDSPQEFHLGVHLAGLPGPNPAFSISEISVGDRSQTLRLPPGTVTVSHMIKNDNGTKHFRLKETLEIKPGEKRTLAIEPPPPEDEELAAHTLTITIVAAGNGQVASLSVGLAKLFDGPLDDNKLQVLDRRLKDVFAIEGKPFDQVLFRAGKALNKDELTKIVEVCKRQKLADGKPFGKFSFVELEEK